MSGMKGLIICGLVLHFTGVVFCAAVILNEYNAVDTDAFLGGGDATADESGSRASDSFFGRVAGNGGDWFELVVIADHLDMRNWKLDIYENGALDETLDLTHHTLWADVRSGTIITVSEGLPSDISYNPAAGDWWIHVQGGSGGDGLYIEATNFPVSSSDWRLRIRNAAGTVIFGPAGEGIYPASGIGGDEIFRLEADPDAGTTANSTDYDSGDQLSTFGSPNQWGRQNVEALRTVVPASSGLTLLSPNGSETIRGGAIAAITWSYTGAPESVLIEFSLNGGITWSPVYPPNEGNSGQYLWLVPLSWSEEALVRISHPGDPAVADTSDAVFTVYECGVEGDVTGDCVVDLADLAILTASWLDCDNPYDLTCTE